MTDRELQKLGRRELLQLLLEQAKESERLRKQVGELEEQLRQTEEGYERLRDRLDSKDAQIHELEDTLHAEREKRETDLENVGSIAEAALRLNGVFDAAQRAADYYLQSIQTLYPLPEGVELPPPPPVWEAAPAQAAPSQPVPPPAEEAARTGRGMLSALERAERVHITTALGTDLTFGKRGRRPGLFNGLADEPGKVGSSSFEIYMGVEETVTEGVAVLDGSLGYLGCPAERIRLTFRAGRLAEIEASASGERLRHYMDSFGDPGIYVAGELGIGLNKISRCKGNCYIEDESTFTTFHIGMGRNLALGGVHDAAGHFDLVFQFPTIYADDILIMKDGFPVV